MVGHMGGALTAKCLSLPPQNLKIAIGFLQFLGLIINQSPKKHFSVVNHKDHKCCHLYNNIHIFFSLEIFSFDVGLLVCELSSMSR